MNVTSSAPQASVHAGQPGPLITYGIPFAVIAVVMALRWRRMSRVMPLRIERLWIVPALYAALTLATFIATPPAGLAGWGFCAFALALGAALGWQRGRLMRINVDPATGALNQTGSPAAMLFLVALVVIRTGARTMLVGGNGFLHLDAFAVTDMLIALALGLFTATRVEMYLRAKRTLEEHRATPAVAR